jgi:NADH dehydrogenase
VLFNSLISFNGEKVYLKSGDVICSRTLIWSAGVRVASLGDRLEVEQGPQGRILVRPTLQLIGHENVYVIGDAASIDYEGEPLPMMAPVAIQQGISISEHLTVCPR